MFKDLVIKNRSYRRFYQEVSIDIETLRGLVDLARISASGGNLQPLKYILSNEPPKNALIFQHLTWAGYLGDWKGPVEGERPAAYIIILGDTEIRKNQGCDHGIAAQNILLGATEKGLGGCLLGAVNFEGLRKDLNIQESYEIHLVVALGKPKEIVVLDDLVPSGDIKYWRDNEGVHHVPKRNLNDIIVG